MFSKSNPFNKPADSGALHTAQRPVGGISSLGPGTAPDRGVGSAAPTAAPEREQEGGARGAPDAGQMTEAGARRPLPRAG